MRFALVAGIVGSASACANAAYIEAVINGPWDGPVGTTFEYSIWLRDGGDLIGFAGWSSFTGRISAPGADHALPTETSNQNSTAGGWDGRRPPSIASFPGGAAGGFRFAPQTFTAIPYGLEGSPGQPFVGRTASVSQGGFLWNQSPDLEVFRGSITTNVAGYFLLEFEVDEATYFTDGHADPIIITDPTFESIGAIYGWVPTPASALLLGSGLLAARRRR